MSLETEKFDVWVTTAPLVTPQGEKFAPTLARVFGVSLEVAERVAREAPVPVKRGISFEDAAIFRRTLESVGASVEILAAGAPPPEGRRVSPSLSAPPMWGAPPPRRSARLSSRPPSALSTAPTVQSAPPPATRTIVVSPLAILVAVLALASFAIGALRWSRGAPDAPALGNTARPETLAGSHFGLTGPGLDAEHAGKVTLIVAWRTGCLSDEYAAFLDGLARAHKGQLAVLAAGLAVPAKALTSDGSPWTPPPAAWPPSGCTPPIDVLPTERGYVMDVLTEPATYLYDAKGVLIAAWHGGMSRQERAQLAHWVEGQPLDR
jgi:hypothetical protein